MEKSTSELEKSTSELKNELKKYELITDPGGISQIIVRGSVRQMFVSKLLKEKLFLCHEGLKYFVTKTQARPMIEQLKSKGFLLEKDDYFFINPDWINDERNEGIYALKVND